LDVGQPEGGPGDVVVGQGVDTSDEIRDDGVEGGSLHGVEDGRLRRDLSGDQRSIGLGVRTGTCDAEGADGDEHDSEPDAGSEQ
jgi:hypothetical protein